MKLGAYDVGYSAQPTAGIGHLVDGRVTLQRVVGGPDAFRQFEQHKPYDVIAIDGPITPHEHDAGLVRTVESLFQRGAFQRRCKCAASHVTGTGQLLRAAAGQAADKLALSAAPAASNKHLCVRNSQVIEAFPNAFLGVCLSEDVFKQMPQLRRGRKFDWLYDQWLKNGIAERLTLGSIDVAGLLASTMHCTRDHEQRAALVCLMTAACFAERTYCAVGDEASGWFFLPPWSVWADWAKEESQRQAERIKQSGQTIEIIRGGSE